MTTEIFYCVKDMHRAFIYFITIFQDGVLQVVLAEIPYVDQAGLDL